MLHKYGCYHNKALGWRVVLHVWLSNGMYSLDRCVGVCMHVCMCMCLCRFTLSCYDACIYFTVTQIVLLQRFSNNRDSYLYTNVKLLVLLQIVAHHLSENDCGHHHRSVYAAR